MDKSRLPSWLQDRKKSLILGIILLCMIVSSFNNTRITIKYADNISVKLLGYKISDTLTKENIIKRSMNGISVAIPGHNRGLTGSFSNINADETLVFKNNGVFQYKSDGETDTGSWSFEDGKLHLKLNNWETTLFVSEITDKTLVLYDGSMYYYYEK
ncbi:MAG: lipocalin family protein [Firmicutes bacterium]|nr:lipocalin family protein [Bacillota bacterium]MBR6025430.1 lipocalin family protein [Bacillota bacterium]